MFLATTCVGRVVLGGSDCLSFSAFSASFRASVYRCLEHRTLNLIKEVFLFFLIRAAGKNRGWLDKHSFPVAQDSLVGCDRNIQEASFRLQTSMNCYCHLLATLNVKSGMGCQFVPS